MTISIDQHKLQEFSQKYFNVLRGTFAGLNLIGPLTADDFFIKQVLDSVLPLETDDSCFTSLIRDCRQVYDVGCGGGFPLLPLAYLLPEISFCGLDARGKKVAAVAQIAQELGISNVKTIHGRLEKQRFDKPCVITMKAVGKVKEMLPLIKATEEVYVCFYKGPQYHELEGEDLLNLPSAWELVEETFYPLPGSEGRWLIIFRNRKATASKKR